MHLWQTVLHRHNCALPHKFLRLSWCQCTFPPFDEPWPRLPEIAGRNSLRPRHVNLLPGGFTWRNSKRSWDHNIRVLLCDHHSGAVADVVIVICKCPTRTQSHSSCLFTNHQLFFQKLVWIQRIHTDSASAHTPLWFQHFLQLSTLCSQQSYLSNNAHDLHIWNVVVIMKCTFSLKIVLRMEYRILFSVHIYYIPKLEGCSRREASCLHI